MASNVRFVDSLKVGQYKGGAGTPGTDFSGSFTGSFEGSGDLTGSFTGSFTGDGSGLINLPISDPFPFTGSAQITGSLGVTGSLDVTGNVGIGTTSPLAKLDITSTTDGVLLPRMTTTQVNAISSPENGLTVYNTTLNTLCFYNGSSWQKVTSANMPLNIFGPTFDETFN